VAGALKVTLLSDVSAKIELGGTRNPAAFDAYLRGGKAYGYGSHEAKALQTAIAAYTEAIRLDPNYSLAFAGRARAHDGYAAEFATGAAEIHDSFDKAQADARKAIVLAPELGEGYLALGYSLEAGSFDLTHATEAYERAVTLAPGSAEVLRQSGRFAVYMGRFDEGVTALRRAVVLDPLNPRSHELLGQGLFFARQYEEAVAAFAEAVTLTPGDGSVHADAAVHAFRGLAFYKLGDFQSARASCETKPDYWVSELCLAVAYDKLGRHADAEAVLAKMKVANADSASVQYAEIYAQWGNRPRALKSLDTAVQVRDPGLAFLKTDPLLDPLRAEPRFRAIERELKFPG
jgi:tetratricopeptide (TPR) repeat protein